MWESIFDYWSIIHVILFFLLGLLIFTFTNRKRLGFSFGMIVAVGWELFERFYLAEHVGFPIFCQTPLNSLSDLVIYDVIGLILGYYYVQKMMKNQH